MNPNQHIKDFLAYYASFPTPPRYAVLVDGPWGVGKTFFVKSIFNSLRSADSKHVYVSLYGLTSLDEIDDAIFLSMYPVLESKGAKIGGRALKTIGKYLNIDLELQKKDILNIAESDLYIFDDLERCEVPINAIMGYINRFVEHEDRKAVIICNEAEIREPTGYTRIREKLVGKTFHLRSVFEEAMGAFISSVQDVSTRSALLANSHTISEVYHQSELNNLRVLQQSMWEFQRVYESLEERHRSNDGAITALLGLLLALAFEVKAGRLSKDDLRRRYATLAEYSFSRDREESLPPPIHVANNRYPMIDIASGILSDETLGDIITKGIVDSERIRHELDQSSFFVTVDREPSWRTLWHAHERSEKEVTSAIAEMDRAFSALEYTATGEILHVFGLKLWLSSIDACGVEKQAVIEECKSYVDSLYRERKLELPLGNSELWALPFDSHDGLGIYEATTPEYRELRDYLNQKRRAQDEERRPEIAEQLLTEMMADASHFMRRICLTNHEDNEYYNVPVLASLAPDRFVGALMDLHPQRRRTVLHALKLRYEHGQIDSDLSPERTWAESVREILLAKSEILSPVSKFILQGLVEHTLDKVLGTSRGKELKDLNEDT